MSIRNMRFIDAELILATSDLTKFVRCGHATYLDHGTKRGTVTPLARRPPAAMTNLIAEQGDEHEYAYLERLRASGKNVVTIDKAPSLDSLFVDEAGQISARPAPSRGDDEPHRRTARGCRRRPLDDQSTNQ